MTASAQDTAEHLKDIVLGALEDLKAQDIRVLDVRNMTSITDIMIIATGRSTRHVKALADNVAMVAKEHGFPPIGREGEKDAEWVLIDLGDVVVHVMLPQIRDFYQLEKLWSVEAASTEER